jgi:hypothetical protein
LTAAVGPLLARGGRRLCEPRAAGWTLMLKVIESVSHGVPAALIELATLGRTLKKRAADVLAYFDRPRWWIPMSSRPRTNTHLQVGRPGRTLRLAPAQQKGTPVDRCTVRPT